MWTDCRAAFYLPSNNLDSWSAVPPEFRVLERTDPPVLTNLRLIKDFPPVKTNRDVTTQVAQPFQETTLNNLQTPDRVPSIVPVDIGLSVHRNESQQPCQTTEFSADPMPGCLAGYGELIGCPFETPASQEYSRALITNTPAAEPFCSSSPDCQAMGSLPRLEMSTIRLSQQESICAIETESSSYPSVVQTRETRVVGYSFGKSLYEVNQSFSAHPMQEFSPGSNQRQGLLRRTRKTRMTEVIEILDDEVEHPGLIGSGTLLQ